MKEHDELSYCGLYCGGCANYKENANCQGCRNEKKLLSDCPTRACAIEKALLYCGECHKFPCKMLSEFYNDGIKHHALAYQNCVTMKKTGVINWLRGQKAKHFCKCGKRLHWFKSFCPDCAEQVIP